MMRGVLSAIGFSLALAGCAGTQFAPRGQTFATIAGEICGAPFSAEVSDAKERSEFVARATCADGSKVEIRSGESRGLEAQASADQANLQALQILGSVVTELVRPLRLAAPSP